MVTFTTDPIYWRPLKPRITVKTLDNVTTLISYDPWTDAGTATKPIYCNVQLSQNHQGIFTVQYEDSARNITGNLINSRVIIECGKQSTQMTRLISGLIRQVGSSRGADGKVLSTISGSSTAIRLNERVTYFVTQAGKLADGTTLDVNDANMKADTLLQTGIALGAYPTTEAIDTNNITTRSDVENIVTSVTVEYGEEQDIVNFLEEASNGEVFVDTNDLVQFRHALQPSVAGRGFTIKNKNATNDNADDTMYLRGRSWDLTESILKSDNYSNHLFAILPPEPAPAIDATAKGSLGFVRNDQFSIAQKFRPPHSVFLPEDIYFSGFNKNGTTSTGAFTPAFAIAGPDTANTPNSLPIIVQIGGKRSDWYRSPGETSPAITGTDGLFLNSSSVVIPGFNLDTTKDYWLILSSSGASTANGATYFAWYQRSTTTGIVSYHTFPDAVTASSTGTGWAAPQTGLHWFAMPRIRSQAFQCWDPKAIKAMLGGTTRAGLIDSTLSGIPSYVKTKEALYKYLVNQIYFMARPRVNYNMGTVTAANVPVLPGDPIMISDSVLGLSAAGNQAEMAVCGDMTYSWGSLGGQGLTYQAPTLLSIQPVSNPTYYR